MDLLITADAFNRRFVGGGVMLRGPGGGGGGVEGMLTHRPLSSSFLGLPYRILNIIHKKEPLRGLWVGFSSSGLGFRLRPWD